MGNWTRSRPSCCAILGCVAEQQPKCNQTELPTDLFRVPFARMWCPTPHCPYIGLPNAFPMSKFLERQNGRWDIRFCDQCQVASQTLRSFCHQTWLLSIKNKTNGCKIPNSMDSGKTLHLQIANQMHFVNAKRLQNWEIFCAATWFRRCKPVVGEGVFPNGSLQCQANLFATFPSFPFSATSNLALRPHWSFSLGFWFGWVACSANPILL